MDTENQSFEEFAAKRKRGRRMKIAAGICAALVITFSGLYFFIASAPKLGASAETFVIPLGTGSAKIGAELEAQGFVRHAWAFDAVIIMRGLRGHLSPGSYTVSKSMNVWEVAGVLSGVPANVWVVIPEGLRKEQIADILAEKLAWSDAQKSEWIAKDTTRNWTAPNAPVDQNYSEGVYFPETYLIPLGEAPTTTARRMQSQFAEKFAPYAAEALKQNVRWPTALKVASLVQREAAGASDMPLVSGIIWNRLLANMPLDIDATVQYAHDTATTGWWVPLKASSIRQLDSPYNTYLHAGLPPTPISNPGIAAIKAALFPEKTACLYYLHDPSGQIHCSATYAGQQQNIQKYLK